MSIHAFVPDGAYWKSQIKCLSSCPVNTDAEAYIRAIREDDYERAYLIARSPNPLASICGWICGAPCEIHCRRACLDRPLSIRALKRVVSESYNLQNRIRSLPHPEEKREYLLNLFTRYRGGSISDIAVLRELAESLPFEPLTVGIVGGGPAGLACAHDLAVLGHRPVVYEEEPMAAGNLFTVLPSCRRPPRNVVLAEVEIIRHLGVEILTGIRVGRDISLAEIRRRHEKTVIAVGMKQSLSLPLPGIHAGGVYGGVEFLRRMSLTKPGGIGREIVVIGGGNVAYDVARSAVRQPQVKAVTVCCLESPEEMPADPSRIRECEEEGVRRLNRLAPKEILTDAQGRVQGVVFHSVLSVFNGQGVFDPRYAPEAFTRVEADTVILAVGQRADLSFFTPEDGIAIGDDGLPLRDGQSQKTSAAHVFAAGDVAHGPRLLIDAIASGKKTALEIHTEAAGRAFVTKSSLRFREISPFSLSRDDDRGARRAIRDASARQSTERPDRSVETVYSPERARREAGRCLRCSVFPVFNSERCILCGGCVDACPHSCLYLVRVSQLEPTNALYAVFEKRYGSQQAAKEGSVILKDETHCIRCGICAARCPVNAVSMEQIHFKEAVVDAR